MNSMSSQNVAIHPLVGILAKIQRANVHLKDFKRAKEAFLEESPFEFTHGEITENVYYVRINEIKPAPLELPLIIGDAIHNLRSALDLLVCQLVRLKVPDHDCRNISFPIANSLEEFPDAMTRAKSHLAGEQVKAILEQWEPYRGGKHEELWTLHRLDIQDKHRLLIVAPTTLDSWHGRVEFIPDSPIEGQMRVVDTGTPISFGYFYVPQKGDTVIALDPILITKGQVGKLHAHIVFTGDIALNEPGIIQQRTALTALIVLRDVVVDTVQQFEDFFPPF